MVARTGTWLAILAGSLFGAFAALIGGSAQEQAMLHDASPRTLAVPPRALPDAAATAPVPDKPLDAAAAPADVAAAAIAVTAAERLQAADAATTDGATPSEPRAPSYAEITSAKELKLAEIKCDSKDPEACVRA